MKLALSPKYIFAFLLLCVSQSAFSQVENKVLPKQRLAIVKFAPSVLLEPQGGVQLGVEVPVTGNVSGQFEYAYMPYSYGSGEGGFFQSRPGFNASAYKAELRYYFTDVNLNTKKNTNYLGKDLQGVYVAGQSQVKIINSMDSTLVFNDEGTQVILTGFKVQTTVFKANLKLGYQVIINDGFVLDFYTGAGYRHQTIKTNPGSYRETLNGTENRIPINFALGLKLGWAF